MKKSSLFILFSIQILGMDLRFANQFFLEKDYYRAAIEFERTAINSENENLKQIAKTKVVESYFLGEQYNKLFGFSISYLKRPDRLIWMQSLAYMKSKKYQEALDILQNLKSGTNQKYQIQLYKSLMGERPICPIAPESSKIIDSTGIDYATLIQTSIEAKNINPWLYGLASALLPGSGQIMAGQFFDGLSALAVVSSLGAGGYFALKNSETAMGVTLVALTSIFYGANVYGGFRAALQFNVEQRDLRARRLFKMSLRYRVLRF